MSDNKQPDTMRPIPDGGLKDAMPAWLKRPPAWRNMPTAEERHERTLPEPDTSVIDPHSLLDVSDLPQWLQAIAERGTVPAPDPDPAIGHGVQQVLAVSTRPHAPESPAATEPEVPSDQSEETPEPEAPSETVTPVAEATSVQEVASQTPTATPQESRSPWLIPLISIALVVILVIVLLVIVL